MNREYLDKVQYKDSSNLRKRAVLHVKYGKGNWFGFVAAKADLEPGMSVLDIGCGAGWFWEKEAGHLPADLEITLADTSEGMVAEALARVRGAKPWQGVAGLAANVCALPFADRSFDRVLALHMLYHAEDKTAALGEIARVLKPGGMAVIATNGEKSMAEADNLRNEAFNLPGDPMIDFTLENAPPLLDVHFRTVELRRSRDVMNCTDPDDIYDYLTSFPPGDSAADDQLDKLRRLIATRFEKGGGVLSITVESGVFRCQSPVRLDL